MKPISKAIGTGLFSPNIYAYQRLLIATFGSSMIGYWPMDDRSGSVAIDKSGRGHNGTYSNVTLGQRGMRDHNVAPYFAGGDGPYCNIHSAGLHADFNGAEGTLLMYLYLYNGGWTDGTARYAFSFYTMTSDFLLVRRSTTNNQLLLDYKAGGVTATKTLSGLSFTGWFSVGMTWSTVNNRVRFWLEGIQSGLDVAMPGVWGGAASATLRCIGAYRTVSTTLSWKGQIAHVLLLNREATPEEIA